MMAKNIHLNSGLSQHAVDDDNVRLDFILHWLSLGSFFKHQQGLDCLMNQCGQDWLDEHVLLVDCWVSPRIDSSIAFLLNDIIKLLIYTFNTKSACPTMQADCIRN